MIAIALAITVNAGVVEPIKPITPIGCIGGENILVTDEHGKSYWVWVGC